MNQATFLRYAFQEAEEVTEGRRQVVLDLRCNLSTRKCRNAVVGRVYSTKIGLLLVAVVSIEATAARQPGRRAMGLTAADTVARYWLLSPTGNIALAHPSPLSRVATPSLVHAGRRPIRVHCAKDQEWIDCADGPVSGAARKAKQRGRTGVLMVPC